MIKIENYRQLHDVDNKERGILIVGSCLSTDEKPLEYAGGSILIETDHDGGFWVWMFDEASMTWILQTSFFDSSSIKCDCPTIQEITSAVLAKLPITSRTKLGIVQIGDELFTIQNGLLGLDLELLKEKLNLSISDEVLEKIKQELQEWVKEYIDTVIGDKIEQVVQEYLDNHMDYILNYVLNNIPIASKTQKGIVQIGDGIDVIDGLISVNTAETLKAGKNVTIENGVISVADASSTEAGVIKLGESLQKDEKTGAVEVVFPVASTSTMGIMKVGTGLSVDEGIVSLDEDYTNNLIDTYKQANYDDWKTDITNYTLENLPIAGETVAGIVKIGDNITVNEAGVISVPIATGDTLGVIKGSNSVVIDANGVASVPLATNSSAGIVVVGDNLSLDETTGTISIEKASKTVYGVAKVGDNINVTDGVISRTIDGGGGTYTLPLMTQTVRGGAKLRDGTTLGDVELDTSEGMYVDVTELDDRITALENA